MHPFLSDLSLLFHAHKKKHCCLYRFHPSKKRIKKRSAFVRPILNFCEKNGFYAGEKQLFLSAKLLIQHFFGERINRNTTEKRVEQFAQKGLLDGVYYKNIIVCAKWKKAILKQLKGKWLNTEEAHEMKWVAHALAFIFEALVGRLLPDLSAFPAQFVDEYEEITEKLTKRSSGWMKIKGEHIGTLSARIKKKGKRRAFFDQLTLREKKTILRCKSISKEVSRLCLLLKKMKKQKIYDYRFHVDELQHILFVASSCTCSCPDTNTYTQLYEKMVLKKLHPQWKKKNKKQGEVLSLKALKEAFSLSQKYLTTVDDLTWGEEELIAKQNLVHKIIVGKKEALFTTPYPFTCLEWQTSRCQLPAISSFLTFFIRKIVGFKLKSPMLTREKVQKIGQHLGKMLSQEEREQLYALSSAEEKKQFLQDCSAKTKQRIETFFVEEKLISSFYSDFLKLQVRIGTGRQAWHFNFQNTLDQYYSWTGEELFQHLKKEYGKTFAQQIYHTQPALAKKKAGMPLDKSIIESIRDLAIDHFWAAISKRLRRRFQKRDAITQKKVRLKRQYIRQFYNQSLFKCTPDSFLKKQKGDLMQQTTLNHKTRIGMLPPSKPHVLIDEGIDTLSYQQDLFFYNKRDLTEKNDILYLKKKQRHFPIAKSLRSFSIELEANKATHALFSGLFVNDRSIDLIDELNKLLQENSSQKNHETILDGI